jgi:hypothetical protein
MTHACLGFVVWPAHQEKARWPRDSGTAKSAVRDAPAQRRPIGVRKRLQLPDATMHACKVPETPRELPLAETVTIRNINYVIGGGEGGIRTHGTVTRTTVFETVPFDHSGTSPRAHVACRPAYGNLRRAGDPVKETRGRMVAAHEDVAIGGALECPFDGELRASKAIAGVRPNGYPDARGWGSSGKRHGKCR